jgi:hypothetical protein
MPTRAIFFCLVIMWITTALWHLSVVEMPHWTAGNPPEFGLALSDETTVGTAPSLFAVWFNNEKAFLGKLSMEFQPDQDAFLLTFEMSGGRGKVRVPGRLARLHTMLNLERKGGFIAASGEIDQGIARHSSSLSRVGNFVEVEQAFETLGIEGLSGRLPPRQVTWPAMACRPVISPFVPSWRWPGLYGGQKWISTLVDPVGDCLRGNQGDRSGSAIVCEVAEELELPPKTRKQPACHRIDAATGDISISVWVLPKTGKVAAQRVRLGAGEEWEFIIEDAS